MVVNDLDADAARAVADEIGGTAVPGDCASEAGVRALVDTATGALGRIDVFFANAGIDGGPRASRSTASRPPTRSGPGCSRST